MKTSVMLSRVVVILAFSMVAGIPTIGIVNPEQYLDGDGLNGIYEEEIFGTDPYKYDTDGNGIPDGDEDHDGDGISNQDEQDKMVKLMDAVEIGNREAVNILLDAGADVDADVDSMTAPASSKSFTTSIWPCIAARISAVLESTAASTSAPASNKVFTASLLPISTASISLTILSCSSWFEIPSPS